MEIKLILDMVFWFDAVSVTGLWQSIYLVCRSWVCSHWAVCCDWRSLLLWVAWCMHRLYKLWYLTWAGDPDIYQMIMFAKCLCRRGGGSNGFRWFAEKLHPSVSCNLRIKKWIVPLKSWSHYCLNIGCVCFLL